MNRDVDRLAHELLKAYRLALHEGHPDVAEHVLRALEQLAKCEPAAVVVLLEQAYLSTARDAGPKRS